MEDGKQIRLTSAEISQLWSTYINDSASMCMLTYFLEKVEDTEIKPILEYSLNLSKTHTQKISQIFKEEGYPVPFGFNIEEDVDLTAPRLFTDSYSLNFVHQMARVGLNAHSINLSLAVRKDVTSFFSECLTEVINLYDLSKEVLLSKGLYIKSPPIPKPKKADFVTEQSFLAGFFGEKRPLTVSEITPLYTNLQRNSLGEATMIGFSQITKDKEVTKFFKRARDIAKEHGEIFTTALKKDYLPASASWSAEVTDSTEYVFSDKLMMFFTTILIGLSVQYYGIAITMSPRRDLGVMYNKLSLEIQLFAEDGSNILIKNGWLEQPPLASDRNNLANQKSEN